MGVLQNIFPFGLWKRLMPVKYDELKAGGLNSPGIEDIPKVLIDYVGPFNEKRLINKSLEYMGSRRYFFSEFDTFAKGGEHNHVLSGFKRVSSEFRVFGAIRFRVHGWEPSGLKDKPDKGFVRIWLNPDPIRCWRIVKDYQGRFQRDPKSWGLYNFFTRYFFRREFDEKIVPEMISDMYGLVEVVKKELGIDSVAYDDGMKKVKRWN